MGSSKASLRHDRNRSNGPYKKNIQCIDEFFFWRFSVWVVCEKFELDVPYRINIQTTRYPIVKSVKVATYDEVYLCVHKQGGLHVGKETGHKVSGP